MKRLVLWLGGGLAFLGAAAALAPVRHRGWVERSEGNPVQRVVLESRSLVGLRLSAWQGRVEGANAWGNSREGFFVSPQEPVQIVLKAWPGFNQTLTVAPIKRAASTVCTR